MWGEKTERASDEVQASLAAVHHSRQESSFRLKALLSVTLKPVKQHPGNTATSHAFAIARIPA